MEPTIIKLPIQSVGIITKADEPRAQELQMEVTRWLLKEGCAIYCSNPASRAATCQQVPEAELPNLVDLIIVLGGDGTLIHAATLIEDQQVALFGVNVGTLGFLTEITTEEIFPALRNILDGNYALTRRSRLDASLIRGRSVQTRNLVLNDAVIQRGALSRMLKLRVTVDSNHTTTYRGDGLIVATPTGSTAYNMSVGGPIVHPAVDSITLTPISPHALTNRCICLPPGSLVDIEVVEAFGEVFYSADGREGHLLELGDIIRLKTSTRSIYVVRSYSRDYFSILRTKLKWGE